ncbi:MAG: AAA family ATPase [Aristaeellaceae bacterium]
MEHYVIAISRQFGALGRTIAQRLSAMLEVEFWDRDIVEEAARRMGQSLSMVSDAEEVSGYPLFPHRPERISLASYSISDEIFDVERSIIRDAALKGSCIIVGRCGDSILRDFPNLLSVYLYAPDEARVRNCVEHLNMDEKTARKTLRNMDLARSYYHRKYCPDMKTVFDGKDLMIDTSRFGVEGTAQLIAGVVHQRWGQG